MKMRIIKRRKRMRGKGKGDKEVSGCRRSHQQLVSENKKRGKEDVKRNKKRKKERKKEIAIN